MNRLKLAALPAVICVAAAVSACGSSGTSASGSSAPSASASRATAPAPTAYAGAATGKLVIDNESGATWTCQFNPYNPAVTLTSFGFVYEPLEFVDILAKSSSQQTTPWLATGSSWSKNYKTLTVTIRSGVKWSDGQPFSAADVVYTFDAMKNDKAIDLNALWSNTGGPLTGVTQSGSKVVFTFNTPAQPYFYYIADQTPILPKHIWSKLNQSKLSSYADTNPVGTGPYQVSSCTPQNIKYLNNPHYWQSKPGHTVPAVREVDYPAFLSNTSANLDLSTGLATWGGQYIPNIKSFYLSKNPNNHYWFPPVENVSLVPNLDNPLLGQLAVRKAIAEAINRATVASRGESGYQQAANQTGVVTPTYSAWFDKADDTVKYDPSQAVKTLEAASFKRGSNGIFKSKSGQPLSFTIKTISGYSDWDASLQLITQQLRQVGIAVTVQDENSGPYTTDLQGGHFELAYAGSGGPAPSPGPSPYYELRGLLYGGDIGSTNYSRFNSKSTNALFNQYPADTPAQQLSAMHQIEKVMDTQIPLIPVTEGVDWYQYNTGSFSGWPTAADPYAQPSPYQSPDLGVVLTHLTPR
ncbi:MAG TPA: ABC transporter substrate-binding protein [Solirubrobacteraceae bacterium]|nr:ABC transporter substrate-binding protein [Solirubrobacteraceae bacterium]